MLLSAVSFLVVAQSSSEIPEGLMNNPVYQNEYTYNARTTEYQFHTAVSEFLVSFFVSQSNVACSRCELGKYEGLAVTSRFVTREVCRINDYFEKKKIVIKICLKS